MNAVWWRKKGGKGWDYAHAENTQGRESWSTIKHPHRPKSLFAPPSHTLHKSDVLEI